MPIPHSHRVLLVEDNGVLAATVGAYLENQGLGVDYAPTGEDALNLCAVTRHAALVLDVGLPRMDGLEFCAKLRTQLSDSTPVLILSARDTLEDKLRGLAAGADDYLTKPFEPAELHARLMTLIRRDRKEKASGDLLKV